MFKHTRLTTDVVALTKHKNKYHILLIKRKNTPWKNRWALPGGFIEKNETLKLAAKRELYEETLVSITKLHALKPFDKPNRDPRGHIISIPHVGLTKYQEPNAGDDALNAKWVPLSKIPKLITDHNQIVWRHQSLR